MPPTPSEVGSRLKAWASNPVCGAVVQSLDWRWRRLSVARGTLPQARLLCQALSPHCQTVPSWQVLFAKSLATAIRAQNWRPTQRVQSNVRVQSFHVASTPELLGTGEAREDNAKRQKNALDGRAGSGGTSAAPQRKLPSVCTFNAQPRSAKISMARGL